MQDQGVNDHGWQNHGAQAMQVTMQDQVVSDHGMQNHDGVQNHDGATLRLEKWLQTKRERKAMENDMYEQAAKAGQEQRRQHEHERQALAKRRKIERENLEKDWAELSRVAKENERTSRELEALVKS